MLKRYLLTAALLFALAFPAIAQDSTAEPAPVVIVATDEAPNEITVEDGGTVVIESPAPTEETPTETETPGGYALAILATAVIMAIVFTPIAYFLARSVPASLLPTIFAQGRALATSGQDYAKTTATPLDDLAFNEMAKAIVRLEQSVGNIQQDMRNLTPGK